MTEPRLAAVVVLAAGEGTRMRSAMTPKVLHPLCGRSMLGHVVHAARGLDPEHLVVVVGHAREQVTDALAELDPAALAVVQEQQHGTGHAVRVGLEGLGTLTGTVVVVPGDAPLLTTATLQALVERHAPHIHEIVDPQKTNQQPRRRLAHHKPDRTPDRLRRGAQREHQRGRERPHPAR